MCGLAEAVISGDQKEGVIGLPSLCLDIAFAE